MQMKFKIYLLIGSISIVVTYFLFQSNFNIHSQNTLKSQVSINPATIINNKSIKKSNINTIPDQIAYVGVPFHYEFIPQDIFSGVGEANLKNATIVARKLFKETKWLNFSYNVPKLISNYTTSAYGVTVSGTIAYIGQAYTKPGFIIVDITNPANLTLLGNLYGQGYSLVIKIIGTTAYLNNGGGSSLEIIDVSNPLSPYDIGEYPPCCQGIIGNSVEISNSIAYLGWSQNSLQIINITNPSSPVVINTYITSGNTMGVGIFGHIAYVTQNTNPGLLIIDITNPASPLPVGNYPFASATDIKISENIAYVITPSGLQIIDVENYANLKLLGSYNMSGLSSLSILGTTICIATPLGIQIIDVSDSAYPVLMGNYDELTSVTGTSISESFVYLASYAVEFKIISQPTISFIGTPSFFDVGKNRITIKVINARGNILNINFNVYVKLRPLQVILILSEIILIIGGSSFVIYYNRERIRNKTYQLKNWFNRRSIHIRYSDASIIPNTKELNLDKADYLSNGTNITTISEVRQIQLTENMSVTSGSLDLYNSKVMGELGISKNKRRLSSTTKK